VESILALASTSPFAGRRVSASLDRLTRKRRESPALRPNRAGDHGVLEQLRRRGAFGHLAMRRRIAGRGKVLHSRRLGPRSPLPSSQLVGGATTGEVVTLPASSATKSGGLPHSNLTATLHAPRDEWGWGLTWLAARSSREGWAHARRAARERGAGGEGKRGGYTASQGSCAQGGRGSDARGTCPCVVVCLQKSIGGAGLREACALHFTRSGSVRGRGSSPRPTGERESAAQGRGRKGVEGRIEAESIT